MRKFSLILIFIFLIKNAFSSSLYLFTGSAFYTPLEALLKNYNKKVTIISGGSGILLQKIILSKKGDIFLPGSYFYLTKAKENGIVLKYKKFIKQVPVFGISSKSKKLINNFNDLCNKKIKIALGNPKTMALGRLFTKMKNKYSDFFSCIEKNSIIKAINVSQIANYIEMNIVDAGILFKSVAKLHKFKIIEIPKKYRICDSAPLILLKTSKDKKSAERLYNFILNHKSFFEKYGYKTF